MEPVAPQSPAAVFGPGEGAEQVARILESITDGFCVHDAEWRFAFLNDAAKRLLAPHVGDPHALFGQVLWEVIPGVRGTALEREYRRAVAEGVATEFTFLNATWHSYYSIRAFPIRGGGLSVYFRDVTAERRAADELRESEARYRLLFESMEEGFAIVEIVWDDAGNAVDFRFLEVNPAFGKHTGLDRPAGRTGREIAPEFTARHLRECTDAARHGTASRFEEILGPLRRCFAVHAFGIGSQFGNTAALLFTDVTERRRAEAEAVRLSAESRERVAELETLLNVLPIGIGIAADRECRNIRVNRAFAEMLNVDPGANASMTAPAGERPASFRVLDDTGREIPGEDLPLQVSAREGREVHGLEVNVVHDDGRVVRLLEYTAPILDEEGVPRGSVGAFVDITERRRSEQRQRFLVRLDEETRALSDPAEIVATAARLLGEFLDVDRCAYADVEADEDTMNITGNYCRGVASIVGRFRFAEFGEEVLRLMRANEPYVVHDIETHRPAPGDLVAYRATEIRSVICVPLHKAGKFVGAMAVHGRTPRLWRPDEVALLLYVANRSWEALERVRITRVMQESEERFRTLADNLPQLAWIADPSGSIDWYNRRWHDYTGTTLEQMLGWGWREVHHPEHLDRVLAGWATSLAAGVEWEDTFPLRSATGEYRWFLSRAFPIRDAEGRVLRWFGTNTDITAQREAAEALTQAKEQAEAASRAKDDFLATLSHELRTPLTPVLLSAAELESDPQLPGKFRPQLAMMRRNIELEARLIDDLLDVTRITRGKLALRLSGCEVHSLIGLALEIVRADAEAKSIRLKLELDARRSHLHGDPARLQQVFWNLFKNAVKYTPEQGRIVIRSSDAGDRLLVEVTDSGLGIPADAIDRIFLPFEQAGLSNDHRFGGLGLGLSISRAIVEMHGGRISAESAGHLRGATFRVELPASAPSPAERTPPLARTPAAATPEPPLDLLLVEDHEPTLAVLARLLQRSGHRVTAVGTAAAARAAAAQRRFDLVISDIGLPDGSGVELMDHLRTAYGLTGIAVTGYGMDDDLHRTRGAGFVAHLTKPIDFEQLRRTVREAVPSRAE